MLPVIQTSTIILWTELFPKKRGEKIQGEILQSIFKYRIQWCFHILQKLQCFHMQSSNSKIFLHTELILLQEFSKKYYNYKAHPVQINTRTSSSNCSLYLQVFYTAESSHKAPTAQAGLQLILPSRNSILSGRQHPHSPYSNSQVHSYRILPGEIGFIPKGLSIVYLCNTKVSVFQFAYSYFRIILQEF